MPLFCSSLVNSKLKNLLHVITPGITITNHKICKQSFILGYSAILDLLECILFQS